MSKTVKMVHVRLHSAINQAWLIAVCKRSLRRTITLQFLAILILLLFVINVPYENNNTLVQFMLLAHTHPPNSKFVF